MIATPPGGVKAKRAGRVSCG